jgi:hypothetical protein
MLPPMSTSGSKLLASPSRVCTSSCARAVLALIVLSSSACVYGELRHVLRAQVASETHCSEVSVVKSPPFQPGYKEHQFLVKGCGVDRVYNCPEEGLTKYGQANCSFVEAGASIKAPPPPAAASGGLDDEPTDLSEPSAGEPAAPAPNATAQ